MTSPQTFRHTLFAIRYRATARRWGIAIGVLLVMLAAALPAAAEPNPPASPTQNRRSFLPWVPANPSAVRAEDQTPEPGGQTYVLKEEDDLATLAIDLGLDTDLMACVTPSGVTPLDQLRPGQTILLPGPRYLCHTVAAGETLEAIAETYQVTPNAIVDIAWNTLQAGEETLEPGRRLLIFDGVRPARPAKRNLQAMSGTPLTAPAAEQPKEAEAATAAAEWLKYGDGHFIWPVTGRISQGYHASHRGIDIAVPWGTPVLAADNGVVIKSGYSTTGYGGRVIIDHNIDYVTLYAHLSQAFVREGDIVRKGQIIGLIGSTGNSTGPHLHFELRDFGYLVDPRTLLPR